MAQLPPLRDLLNRPVKPQEDPKEGKVPLPPEYLETPRHGLPLPRREPPTEGRVERVPQAPPTPPTPAGVKKKRPRILSAEMNRDLTVDRVSGGPLFVQAGVGWAYGEENKRSFLNQHVGTEGEDWRFDSVGEVVLRDRSTGKETSLYAAGMGMGFVLGQEAGPTAGTTAMMGVNYLLQKPWLKSTVPLRGMGLGFTGPWMMGAYGTGAWVGGELVRRATQNPPQNPGEWETLLWEVIRDEGPIAVIGEIAGFGLGKMAARAVTPMGRQVRLSAQQKEIFAAIQRVLDDTQLQMERRKWSPARLAPDEIEVPPWVPKIGGKRFKIGGTHRRATPADVLPPGALSGNHSWPRIMALLERHPGSAGALRRMDIQQREARALLRTHYEGPQTPLEELGETMASELQRQFDEDVAFLQARELAVENVISGQVRGKGYVPGLTGATRPVRVNEAANYGRLEYAVRWRVFDDTQNDLFNRAQALPYGDQPIVSTAFLSHAFNDIIRDIPITRTTGKPAQAALPGSARNIFEELVDLDPHITIRQARRLRAGLNDALRKPEFLQQHGFREGDIKHMSNAITDALRDAERALETGTGFVMGGGAQTAAALREANKFYKENIDLFLGRDVVDFSIEGRNSLSLFLNKVKGGDTEPINRIKRFFGEDSPTWKSNLAGVWNDMLDDSVSLFDPGRIDAAVLLQKWNSMKPEMREALFGADAAQIGYELRGLYASQNLQKVDLNVLQGWNSPIVARLQSAKMVGEQMALEWKNQIVKPFIRGELGPEVFNDTIHRANFVNYLMTKGAPSEAEHVIARLTMAAQRDPAAKQALRRLRVATVVDLLDRATKYSAEDIVTMASLKEGEWAAILGGGGRGQVGAGGRYAGMPTGRVTLEKQPLPLQGQRVVQLMEQRYGKTPAESLRRLEALIGPEQMSLLKDLALVNAATVRELQSARAMAGLAAGSILYRALRGGIGQTASDMAKFYGFATIIQAPGIRRWLASEFVIPKTAAGARSAVLGGQVINILYEDFKHDPATFADIAASFGLTPEEAKRMVRPRPSVQTAPARRGPGLPRRRPQVSPRPPIPPVIP